MEETTKRIIDPELKAWVIEKIFEKRKLKMNLCILLNKAEVTMNKYLRENHMLLSKEYSLQLISEYLSAKPDELIQERQR